MPNQLKPQSHQNFYRVSRASLTSADSSPCEGALKFSVTKIDRRTVDDPKKIPANLGHDGDWYTVGTNHRIENGEICRDTGSHPEWLIEIVDLWKFVEQHGDCVIAIDPDGIRHVTIYDDRIEA